VAVRGLLGKNNAERRHVSKGKRLVRTSTAKNDEQDRQKQKRGQHKKKTLTREGGVVPRSRKPIRATYIQQEVRGVEEKRI